MLPSANYTTSMYPINKLVQRST